MKKMCRALDISQSGFYKWEKAPASRRKLKNDRLEVEIQEIYKAHNGMAGSPIITVDLHDRPEFFSRPRVARIMKKMGLKCRTVRKFVATTDSKHNEPVTPNSINRHFSPSAPDKVWVSDITYIRAGNKYYLTVFIDLFPRINNCWLRSE